MKAFQRAVKKTMRKQTKVAKKAPKTKKNMVTLIKKVINRGSETKMNIYYSNAAGLAGDGLYSNRSYMGQNQFISNTLTDLKRLLPFNFQGTEDNQRIGDSLQPISLKCNITVKLNNLPLSIQQPIDIFVVLYVLEHKTYKSYTSLIPTTTGIITNGNKFDQLLDNGENSTVPFQGDVWHSNLPVAKQYYKVIKKKKFRIRYAGATNVAMAPAGAILSIANSHDYVHNLSFTLTKKDMPANFRYQEGNAGVGIGDPQNFAPFFCLGYYNADGSATTTPQVNIDQTYTTQLLYKDI